MKVDDKIYILLQGRFIPQKAKSGKNMNKNINKTEQTKNDIKSAFLRIMEQKKFEEITIREVAEISGYHRSTIYLYFKNVNDILSQIESDILEEFHESMRFGFEKNPPKDEDEFVRIALSAFRKQSSLSTRPLYVLLGANGDMSFYNTVKDHFKIHVRDIAALKDIDEDDEIEYMVEFISSGVVSVIRRWFDSGMTIPAENIVAYLAKYIASMIRNL